MAAKYRILLPKTRFPLRANPVTHEPAIQKAAKFDDLYDWQKRERNSGETFTLHDGPPYANGEPHMGHVLNKVLKDIVNRFKLLRGYRLSYRPGWDCHGLPIELKACKESDFAKGSPLAIRAKAAQFALKTLELQREAFKRWGCLGDWGNPYITMDPEYEANQVAIFYKMYAKGCIYRGFKPVHWSPSSRTALAEAELEYRDHTSRAVYVFFPISKLPPGGAESCGDPTHALVWTTTPWTLVANRAVCYNPEHEYSVVRIGEEGGSEKRVLVGSECIPRLAPIFGQFSVISTLPGTSLRGSVYAHPLYPTSPGLPFLPGSHVTESEGTGLVHTAPAHGFEDYRIGVRLGLDLQCCVDERGKYSSEVEPELRDLSVLSQGNEAVISKLETRGLLLDVHSYVHRYPYDWRTKQPIIIRSTEQWFASVSDLKDEAKTSLNGVKMHPSSSINQLLSMLDTRDDWCISRQRVWGVPIPVFYHKESGEALLSDESVSHVEKLIRAHGSDCWWKLPVEELLPPSMREESSSYMKGTDTMDVWFDSGSSWGTVLKDSDHVADMYLEGSDQHRGWFQSSLLTSVAAQGKAPYKEVVTHGFVLDGKGNKMSKSLGNVVSPADIIERKKYGADVMRLWVSSSNFTLPVSISDDVLRYTNDVLQKIRNTVRFLLGNLSDFDPSRHLVPYSGLSQLDRYLLHVLHCYCSEATHLYDSLGFSKMVHLLVNVVPTDLSSFYFDVIKDRLYCDPAEGRARRSTQTTLHHLLRFLTSSIAPVTPHLAEEVAQHYPHPFEGGAVRVCTLLFLLCLYSVDSITQIITFLFMARIIFITLLHLALYPDLPSHLFFFKSWKKALTYPRFFPRL